MPQTAPYPPRFVHKLPFWNQMARKMSDKKHFGAAYSLSNSAETKAHYKRWAATYDSEIGAEGGYAQPARTAEMAIRFLDIAKANVLDAGCGSGLSGMALHREGCRSIDGCDFSPEMLAKAEEKKVYKNLWQADLNTKQAGVADETYDLVTAVGVFSFGHVSPDACDELLRITRKGGFVIIALNDPFWQRGDLANKLNELEKAGKLVIKAKEYGDHLPAEKVMGWVIAAQKI